MQISNSKLLLQHSKNMQANFDYCIIDDLMTNSPIWQSQRPTTSWSSKLYLFVKAISQVQGICIYLNFMLASSFVVVAYNLLLSEKILQIIERNVTICCCCSLSNSLQLLLLSIDSTRTALQKSFMTVFYIYFFK